MTWKENYDYHNSKAKNCTGHTWLYHTLCMNRADQQMHGVKSGYPDYTKCDSKCLYDKAVKAFSENEYENQRNKI